MSLQIVLLLLLLGSCTGFLAGLLGIGGGMIITPFLTMLLGYMSVPEEHVVHIAIATSLATILFTSISSVRAHHQRGAVLWRVAFGIACGILLGALLGARVSTWLPTFWVALVFTVFVGFSALKMFFNAKPAAARELPGLPGLFSAGTVIGFISGIVGAGGGFISVPFMVWCNVRMHNAVGTSAALGFPIAFAGTVGYVLTGIGISGLPDYCAGYVYIPALACIASASIFTAPLGAKVAHSIDTKPLKRIFACMLFVLAGYMFTRAIAAF